MKYVLLGTLNPEWVIKHNQRFAAAKAKLKDLGIKLTSVQYTQGQYDFVTLVDAPSPDAMLSFSVWYAGQGYGRIQSLPAFEAKAIQGAVQKAAQGPKAPAPRRAKRRTK